MINSMKLKIFSVSCSILFLFGCAVTAGDFSSWAPEERREKITEYVNHAFDEVKKDFLEKETILQQEIVSGIRYVTVSKEEQRVDKYDCRDKKGIMKGDGSECTPIYKTVTIKEKQSIILSAKEKEYAGQQLNKIKESLEHFADIRDRYLEDAQRNAMKLSPERLFELYNPAKLKERIEAELLIN